jgi:hypothetical protein
VPDGLPSAAAVRADNAHFQKKEDPMATDDDFFLAFGRAFTGMDALATKNDRPAFRYGLGGLGSIAGAYGRAGLAQGPQPTGPFFGFAGVVGESHDDPGTAGTSVNNIGVYGQTEELDKIPRLVAGVYGTGNIQPGAVGWSKLGLGVEGRSGEAGPPVGMNIPTTAGIVGTADQHPGVIGTSNKLMGVYGFSAGNGGVVGETANPNSFAGYFQGNVMVIGTLTATAGKNAVVPFPDGTQRVLHCMESPEHWFEDFGAAKLKRGRAVVKLDADFGKVFKRGDYRVFVTPEGDCRGLYVRRKRAASFEVRELAGGKSSIAFFYRIVGRRKDVRGHKRFAKIDTRLPLPAAAARAPRKRARTRTERHAPAPRIELRDGFAARLEARQRASKGAR